MKRILILVFFLILVSCDDGQGIYISDSSGNLNMINIITESDYWESEVGETVREILADDAEGLPQREPLYKLKHIPSNAFSGFAKKNRTFIWLKIGNTNSFTVAKDTFARPQTGIFIEGKSQSDLIELFKANTSKITTHINNTEILEKWRRMNLSLEDDSSIKNKFGINIKFPTAYRFAKSDSDDFVWLRKEIDKGSMEIFVYEVPLTDIENENSVITNIVKIRDSIGKAYIPGPRPDTYMITEEAYMPYLYETKIDNKFAYETKGTWVVKDAFMGGPFINYAIKDEDNNRFVIIEGIVYKPTAEKRNNIFEIEAIARSAKF